MYSVEQFDIPKVENIHKPDELAIFWLSGRSRSGKGLVGEAIANYYSPYEIYKPSTSREIKDWLKNHPEKPNLDPTTKELYEAGCEMQALYGEDVFVRKFVLNAIGLYKQKQIVGCVIDSLRREQEALSAKALHIPGIWVEADFWHRWNWLKENSRPEDPKTPELLAERDWQQEAELMQIRQQATFHILNNGTKTDLNYQVYKKIFHLQHPI